MPKAWWLLALPFIAGSFLPLQAGINGQLAKQISSVMSAALVSFLVGTVALLAVVLVQRELPTLDALKGLSWWQWSGGLLGAFFIATAAFAGPRIGALLFMVLVLAGQLGMALLLDHFGWAGYREAPIMWGGYGYGTGGEWPEEAGGCRKRPDGAGLRQVAGAKAVRGLNGPDWAVAV